MRTFTPEQRVARARKEKERRERKKIEDPNWLKKERCHIAVSSF